MARLLGPDMGSRMVILPSGARGNGLNGTVYADAAGTVLADILAYQPTVPGTPGAAITGSVVTTDAFGMLPLWWFPDGVDVLWVTVNNGPLVPINADYDARMDALGTRVTTAETGKASTAALTTHIGDVANPHAVTKTQVGLSLVDNTADTNKPVSVAQQTALDGLELFTLRTLGYMDNAIETAPRNVNGSISPGTGRIEFSYFYAYRTQTIGQIGSTCQGTAAVGLTGLRRGICTVAGNGDLTLVARTALQTSGVYTATFTEYVAPLDVTGGFPAAYQFVKGSWYAFAHWVTWTTTAPALRAYTSNQPASTNARAPRLAGGFSGQTDIPLTILAANINGSGNAVTMFAIP